MLHAIRRVSSACAPETTAHCAARRCMGSGYCSQDSTGGVELHFGKCVVFDERDDAATIAGHSYGLKALFAPRGPPCRHKHVRLSMHTHMHMR